jgi:hypothetical protein
MKLTVEMIEKLKDEYDNIYDEKEAFGFTLALIAIGVSSDDILEITTSY